MRDAFADAFRDAFAAMAGSTEEQLKAAAAEWARDVVATASRDPWLAAALATPEAVRAGLLLANLWGLSVACRALERNGRPAAERARVYTEGLPAVRAAADRLYDAIYAARDGRASAQN